MIKFGRKSVIATLVLLGMFFSLPALAAVPDDFITSVDVMKFTKDRVANQPTDAQIEEVVRTIMDQIKPRYISISVPLDPYEDYPIKSKPVPRDPVAFTKAWTDAIRTHGAKVIFRGTWSAIEGIYDFPKAVGPNRFPAGTKESAETDGKTTWLGKTHAYIVSNPDLFRDGDIWAVLPERTEGIFKDETSFLSYEGEGIQSNYAKFFVDLKTVSDAAFRSIGKKVITGYTANNYSELGSTWMRRSLTDAVGILAIDHYGINHTPSEMESDIRKIHQYYGKPVFLQEWGDYWNKDLPAMQRTEYLKNMYAVFEKLAREKILIGFNYWGGWENDLEGILVKQGDRYSINERGKILAGFFSAKAEESSGAEAKQEDARAAKEPPAKDTLGAVQAAESEVELTKTDSLDTLTVEEDLNILWYGFGILLCIFAIFYIRRFFAK